DDPRGELVRSDGSPREDGQAAEDLLERWFQVAAHRRSQDENPPEAVHDRRHGRQELDDVGHRNPEPPGGEFGEEDGDPQTDWYPDEEGEGGGNEGPVHEWQGPEHGHGLSGPSRPPEEAKTERLDGRDRRQEKDHGNET